MGTLASGCGAVELIGSLHRRQSRLDPGRLSTATSPTRSATWTWSAARPRPSRNPTFVKTNITPNGQAAALVVRGNPSSAGG